MWRILDSVPYSVLVILTVMALLVPFVPMPHALEKIRMLFRGELTKPIDIFDLVFHTIPAMLLLAKFVRYRSKRRG